jgi:hypothetical protein
MNLPLGMAVGKITENVLQNKYPESIITNLSNMLESPRIILNLRYAHSELIKCRTKEFDECTSQKSITHM